MSWYNLFPGVFTRTLSICRNDSTDVSRPHKLRPCFVNMYLIYKRHRTLYERSILSQIFNERETVLIQSEILRRGSKPRVSTLTRKRQFPSTLSVLKQFKPCLFVRRNLKVYPTLTPRLLSPFFHIFVLKSLSLLLLGYISWSIRILISVYLTLQSHFLLIETFPSLKTIPVTKLCLCTKF